MPRPREPKQDTALWFADPEKQPGSGTQTRPRLSPGPSPQAWTSHAAASRALLSPWSASPQGPSHSPGLQQDAREGHWGSVSALAPVTAVAEDGADRRAPRHLCREAMLLPGLRLAQCSPHGCFGRRTRFIPLSPPSTECPVGQSPSVRPRERRPLAYTPVLFSLLPTNTLLPPPLPYGARLHLGMSMVTVCAVTKLRSVHAVCLAVP